MRREPRPPRYALMTFHGAVPPDLAKAEFRGVLRELRPPAVIQVGARMVRAARFPEKEKEKR